MKKFGFILLLAVMILSLAGCSASDLPAASQSSTVQGSTGSSTEPITATDGAQSVAEAQAENSALHEDEADYSWDSASAIQIELNGDAIGADATGVKVDGSTVTLAVAGTYELSGTLKDGQIIVDTQGEGTVQLVLNGVTINSSTSAPIYVKDAKKVVVILADGTDNTLNDGLTYGNANADEDEPNAALFSKADLSIGGSGSLTVNGNSNDGIASKDGLIIAGGTITVTAVDDGIRGKDYVAIEDGNITVKAGGDGIKSDNAEDATKGYISIAGGALDISAGGDGLTAQTDLMIAGGDFTIVTAGGSGSSIADTLSAKAMKGTASVVIDGGTFTIDAADDALHSNGSITVNNGTFQIASGDDGMHADAALTINDGDIQINQSYEGLESAVITINAGAIDIAASDDGINVAGGADGSGMAGPGGMGGGRGQDAFSSNSSYMLYIRGGTIVVNAYGDGLDSNGGAEMSGGTVLVSGPTDSGNGALDAGTFNITGGTLIAAGSAGMATAPSSSSSQNSVLINFDNVQQGGSLVHVQDSAGNEIFTFAPAKEYQSIVFSLPSLTLGETYTVYVGGSASGDNSGGLIQGGTYTAGEQYASLTLSSVVTGSGNTGGFGGGFGGGGHKPKP